MNAKRVMCSAALLMVLAGSALAQTDGRLTNSVERAKYGAPKWVQNVTTGFGDAGPSNPCDNNGVGGDPAAVRKGVEFKIPLSSIGNPTGAIKLMAFINGQSHDYASNQFLPSLPAQTGNLGGDGTGTFTGNVGGIDLTTFAGNQFVSVTPAAPSAAIVVDGTLDVDGSDVSRYGPAVALQLNRTGFGNATTGTQAVNGSELDAMYVAQDATHLYIFLAGNMQGSDQTYNKLEVFIDSVTGGQNPIASSLPDFDGGTMGKFVGFRFDNTFEPDYIFAFGAGGTPIKYYPNFADLNALSGGFIGCNTAGDGSGVLDECGSPPAIEIALDNSNVGGVGAPCPPPAGNSDVANGSEIDAVFAYVEAGRLHVLITGNVENGGGTACDAGGNKLNIFFDANGPAEGQNTMLSNAPGDTKVVDISYGNLARLGGMTFDDGFAADYWMSVKTGGSSIYQVMDAAVLRTLGMRKNFAGGALDYGAYDGGTKAAYNPVTFRGFFSPCNGNVNDPQPQTFADPFLFTNYAPRAAAESLIPDPTLPTGTPGLIEFSINNGNFGGVQGTNGSVSDAANVSTGTEISIDLTELGWDGHSCIKIAGFITSGDVNYGSNQVIGGLPDQNYGNLGNQGNMSTINFNNIGGTQWVTIVDGDNCDGGNGCPPCAADFDQDGGVTGSDIQAFFEAFEGGGACGDVDEDGGVTGADIEFFFFKFEAGGC